MQRLLAEHGWRPSRVRVPRNAPGSKEQWREWSDAHWPLTWRVPVRRQNLVLNGGLAPFYYDCIYQYGSNSPCRIHISDSQSTLTRACCASLELIPSLIAAPLRCLGSKCDK